MTEIGTWFASNWTFCIAILWAAEKIVKLSPTKYDDITLEIITAIIRKLAGKEKK